MNIPNKFLHPLQHDGVSRKRRQLEALLPSFVSVNEREVEDLLLYARQYAQMLQFYDESGTSDGDWLPFLEGDATVVASIILKEENAQVYQHRFHAQLDIFESDDGTDIRSAALNQMLLLLLEMAEKILYWQTSTVPGLSFSNHLNKLIPSVAGDGFCRLIAYLRRATILGIVTDDLLLDQYEVEWPYLEPPRSFSPLKEGMPETEQALFREVVLLRQLFNKFFEVIAPVLVSAPAYLQETLDQHPEHEPHMALFLSFLLLMEEVRGDMNTLTKRHIEFYYREVLQLDNAPAVMDQAHLVLELAQGFINGLLETTDRFLDGKDSNNKDILFAPDEELVVTPASFEEEHGLKTLFFDKNRTSSEDEAPAFEILNAYGAPDADSEDRKSADGKWIPLGSKDDPAARFGFAIASPMFLLGEGEREITLRFGMKGLGETVRSYSISEVRSELENNVAIYFSGEKSWEEISSKSVLILSGEEILEYTLTLDANHSPIVSYHKDLVDQEPVTEQLSAEHPVLLFKFDNFGLSVIDDLDLSLKGSLKSKEFDSNSIYSEGEITYLTSSNQDSHGNNILEFVKAQAEVIGRTPDHNLDIWEEVTSGIDNPENLPVQSTFSLSISLEEGNFVLYNGITYRVNSDLAAGFSIAPDTNINKLIWEPLEDALGQYSPGTGYQPGNRVEYDGGIFIAQGNILPITPDNAITSLNERTWKEVIEGSSLGVFEQSESGSYQFGNEVFQLLAPITETKPALNGRSQDQMWLNITNSITTFDGNTFEAERKIYDSSRSSIRQLLPADTEPIRKTDAPPGSGIDSIWEPLIVNPFQPSTPYNPGTLATSGSKLHRNSFRILPQEFYVFDPSQVDNRGLWSFTNEAQVSPESISNDNPAKIWILIEEIIGTIEEKFRKAGSVIWYKKDSQPATNHTGFFYIPQDITASQIPDPNSGPYHFMGKVTDTPYERHPIGANWDSNMEYNFGDIVNGTDGQYYAASVKNTGKNPINDNPDLWLETPFTEFSKEEFYNKDQIVRSAGFFNAGYRSRNLVPAIIGEIWSPEQSVIPFSDSIRFNPGDIAVYNNSEFWEAQVNNEGLSRPTEQVLWRRINNIAAYSPIFPYQLHDLVEWEFSFYQAEFDIVHFAPNYARSVPANANGWDFEQDIHDYVAGEVYGTNSGRRYVKYQAGSTLYYITNVFETADTHPSLGLPIWEPVPLEFEEYLDEQIYPIAAYVNQAQELLDTSEIVYKSYRSAAGTQFTSPENKLSIWGAVTDNEDTTIPFHSFPFEGDSPGLGAYVYSEEADQMYRLLTQIPSATPNTDSVEWQPVGEIRYHNPAITWYKNMHVRDSTGNVFRALENVDANTPINNPEFWKEASGSYPYKFLVQPSMVTLEILVSVSGIRNLILENDLGTINSAKPFMPFGAIPGIDSLFYIGSYEVFTKSLQSLSLQVEWGSLPDDLVEHYSAYKDYQDGDDFESAPDLVTEVNQFKMSAFLLNEYDWRNTKIKDQFSMFIDEKGTARTELSYSFSINQFTRDPDLPVFTGSTPVPRKGFMALNLLSSFFSDIYSKILAQIALDTSSTKAHVPNPPYTPLINSLTLDYTAKETIVFQDKAKGDLQDLPEQFFHLHPYGWTEFVPVEESLDDGQGPIATNHLVPRYEAQVGDENGQAGFTLQNGVPTPEFRDAAGNLFLGIKDLNAPQILNIFVQVAEGSENPAVDKRFVSWSYLRDNRWVQFEPSQILSDDSNGFLRPGIVKISVPSDITKQNTMLPDGISWIRAAVAEDPDGVGQIYDVRLHAVKATFEDNENDLSRLSTSLEATSLSKLFFRKAVIKKVEQPFASFGGNLEEQDSDFYQRVSERLRHKQRAITIFDYERLVLTQFPTVYQVKCITHAMGINDVIPTSSVDDFLHEKLESGIEHRPGMVQVIVLPDLRNQNAIDPLRPRVSNNLRDEIQTFLNGFCSGFSQVKVENPVFEEVAVLATVTLLPGKDPGFYLNKLNEDLITYLSPWRFDTDYDLHFGGELHISPLIDFMDELDYIDYVDHVALQVSLRDSDGISHPLEAAQEAVCTHTSASVLVSAPTHSITLNESVTPC